MAMMVGAAQMLPAHLRRPPTPPKDSTSKLAEGTFFSDAIPSHQLLDTPDDSPSSSAEYFQSSLAGARKRVKISGLDQYHPPPSSSTKGYDSDDLRALPRSRDCKSKKSILKAAREHSALHRSNENINFDESNLQTMFRSANQHLANGSRTSILDAYNTLSACLSTYGGIPESEELDTTMADLTRYLKRDISTRISASNTADLHIVVPALKVATFIVGTQGYLNSVPDDFKLFVAEESIASLEDANTPKMILAYYMELLGRQRLGPKMMTADRTHRLLSALDKATTQAKSTRLVCHRLMIYKRLLAQAKSIMVSKVEMWLHHLISGLLSSTKDIRLRAIAFGTEAGLQLGAASSVSRACIDISNQKSPQDQKIIEILRTRARSMIRSGEDSSHVPQIWSVIILLLRSRRSQIESWEHFGAWKEVIQSCLDSSDVQTKHQAHVALNRLVYAINVDTMTPAMAQTLKKMVTSQLEQKFYEKSIDKKVVMSKQSARSTYCMLLYYTLHPAASHAQLDQYWDLYIGEVLPTSFSSNKAAVNYACEIVSSLLLNSGPPRVWNEKKANAIGPVTPPELPSLDAKWVRSRVGKIMITVERLSDRADWNSKNGKDAPILAVWRNLFSAIGSASSKEVRVSTETTIAVSHVLSQIKRHLDRSGDHENEAAAALERADILINEAIARIGPLAFNERRIMLTAHKSFEATSETPSSRLKTKSANLNSAVVHLLQLLLDFRHDEGNFASGGLMTNLVQVAIQAAQSRSGKLNALRGLARLCASEDHNSHIKTPSTLWTAVAESTITVLNLLQPSETPNHGPYYPGHDIKDTMRILEIGSRYHSPTTTAVWERLFDQVNKVLTSGFGTSSITVSIIEPLADAIHKELDQRMDACSLNMAQKLLEKIHWPQSRNEFERTQTQLWGEPQGHIEIPVAGLSDNLLSVISFALDKAYSGMTSLSSDSIHAFLTVVISVIHACPPTSKVSLLEKIQSGLAMWFEDAAGVLAGPGDRVFIKVRLMWALAATVIESVRESSNDLLSKLHPVVTAGLRSRHKAIMNDAVLMWNRTFGNAEYLEYTSELSKALLKLRSVTEIDMPGLANIPSQECDLSPFHFVDSQGIEDQGLEKQPPSITSSKSLPVPILRTPSKAARSFSPAVVRLSASPVPSSRRSVKTTPKVRLRHDNSQIQFAAIESSPLAPNEPESQMLTDRQKEVKERQQQAAVMFPDIRSSPNNATKPAEPSLPRFALKAKEGRQPFLSADDETSPILPVDTVLNGFLGSSPTPSSSRHRSQERSMDDEVPSSPHLVSSRSAVVRLSSASPVAGSDGSEQAPPIPSQTASDEMLKRVSDLEPRHSGLRNMLDKGEDRTEETNLLFDQDVFVDAPSEPQISSTDVFAHNTLPEDRAPVENSETTEAELVIMSNHSQDAGRQRSGELVEISKVNPAPPSVQSSQYSKEDGQVEAQLLAEMQGSQTRQSAAKLSQSDNRKRKHSVEDSATGRKRVATASHGRSGLKDRLLAHEIAADCVLIDARPAQGIFRSVSPEKEPKVKQERSESPPGISFSSISTTEETSKPGRRSTGRAKSSNGRRQSSAGQASVRRSERKVKVKEEPSEDGRGQRLPCRRARRSTDVSEASRASPMSSDPLHGDEEVSQLLPSSSASENARTNSGRSTPRSVPLSLQTGRWDGTRSDSSALADFTTGLSKLKHGGLSGGEAAEIRALLLQAILESQTAEQRYGHG